MEGKNFEDVIKIFEKEGFTNIKTEKIDDLIFGWLTEEGEVEEVSVGGDVGYSPDEWVPADIEVIVKYHCFPDEEETETTAGTEGTEPETVPETMEPAEVTEETTEETEPDPTETEEAETVPETKPDTTVLTVDNCPELKEILSMNADMDVKYSVFALKYKGRTIAFDGRIDYCTLHGNYKTRYDFLVSAGDYDPDHQIGPYFKFEDVNYYDLNTDLDEVGVGINVRIVAEVVEYNSDNGLFFLKPVSVTGR